MLRLYPTADEARAAINPTAALYLRVSKLSHDGMEFFRILGTLNGLQCLPSGDDSADCVISRLAGWQRCHQPECTAHVQQVNTTGVRLLTVPSQGCW